MNLNGLIQVVSSSLDAVRGFLAPIPAFLMLCTATRRPGFLSTLTSAKIYADMNLESNDDIVKAFVYNVVDKFKQNLQDDSVCFIAIPPGELKFELIGGNAGGPIVLNENPANSNEAPSNATFVFALGIIR